MFNREFVDAFNHVMKYEVGAFWDPADPEVISGMILTRDQRRKTGYTNDPDDTGGETKFGIAKSANPGENIAGMNLDEAMVIYYNRYWLLPNCNEMPAPLSILHFDGCVNHGNKQAGKFLQRALGFTDKDVDGDVGIRTLTMLKNANSQDVMNSIIEQRRQFYLNIVARKPTQAKFLKGWLNRINDIQTFVANYKV